MDSQFGNLVLGAAAFAVGMMALAFGGVYTWFDTLDRREKAEESLSWPTAPGHVVSSEIKIETTNGVMDSPPETDYSPRVIYEYTVSGKDYTSSRIRFGGLGSSYSKTASLVSKYPAGNNVHVHYDPESPADSVLEPGIGPSLTSQFAGSAIAIAVGLMFAALGLRFLRGPLLVLFKRMA